ncbi:SGNH/GDSL hydrolase family protein [Demequina lignilytica]|uniref:SGNH/GDSL hydrolase family protein n=1 Tax=Demequina lignilytica TaxID=3051663 RepID=A0AB35MKE6_9MICO|nr:SGNH/GDSL hydrolase family protein [Demequina sp. SYSU T0a273]MDN4484170.1 SGNH/GDSL hydrolase family protein [Demequina sp. SYSU T0a273]
MTPDETREGRGLSAHRHRLFARVGGAPVWLLAATVLAIVAALIAWTARPATPAASWDPLEPIVTPTATTAAEPEISDVLFVGDSYTAGAGATEDKVEQLRWSARVSQELGWNEINVALGGTGYVMTSGFEGCGVDFCPRYRERILTADADPDLVVISGGRNDGPEPEGFYQSVLSTFETAQERWPDAMIVVTLPLWDDDPAPEWLAADATVILTAARSAEVDVLDLGQPLEGVASFIAEDGIHPSDAGHEAIAAAFIDAWNARAEAES